MPRRWILSLCMAGVSLGAVSSHADDKASPAPVAAATPTTLPALSGEAAPGVAVADLKRIQSVTQRLLPDLIAATVSLRTGLGEGSGVIISPDGYVMTAAHVIGKPGDKMTVILGDGRRLRATSMGVDHELDAGLAKLTDPGPFPYRHVSSVIPSKGQWTIAMGHPGGFVSGRPAVLRLGRVLQVNNEVLVTDNTLVGGDSGGPLFDLAGNVIGINSRIGGSLTQNIHVPSIVYQAEYARLAASEEWGEQVTFRPRNLPYLGIMPSDTKDGVRVQSVTQGSPAAKAGLKTDDLIVQIEGISPATTAHLTAALIRKGPDKPLALTVKRNGEEQPLQLSAILEKPRQ